MLVRHAAAAAALLMLCYVMLTLLRVMAYEDIRAMFIKALLQELMLLRSLHENVEED